MMQRQVLGTQKAQRTVDVPLLQYIDTTVDVPVAKQHEDCMTKHNEIEMDKKLLPPSSGPTARRRWSSTVRVRATCVSGFAASRRCVTLTTPAERLFADEAHACFLKVPQSHSTRTGRAAHRGAQHRRSCARSVSQSESSNRSSMCLFRCRS